LCVCTHVLVNAVLVDGPDGGHVSGEQLLEGDPFVAGPGADEARLADGRVADHDALDEFLVGLLIIHLTSTWPEAPHRPNASTAQGPLCEQTNATTIKTTYNKIEFLY